MDQSGINNVLIAAAELLPVDCEITITVSAGKVRAEVADAYDGVKVYDDLSGEIANDITEMVAWARDRAFGPKSAERADAAVAA